MAGDVDGRLAIEPILITHSQDIAILGIAKQLGTPRHDTILAANSPHIGIVNHQRALHADGMAGSRVGFKLAIRDSGIFSGKKTVSVGILRCATSLGYINLATGDVHIVGMNRRFPVIANDVHVAATLHVKRLDGAITTNAATHFHIAIRTLNSKYASYKILIPRSERMGSTLE